MTNLSTPIITWTDLVRAHLPDGATAYPAVGATSDELKEYTSVFDELWTVWVGSAHVGILCRGRRWLWATDSDYVSGARVDVLPYVARSVAKKLQNDMTNRDQSGEAPHAL